MDDFYDILGIDPSSTDDDIKKAYKQKALECHPDRNQGDSSKEEMFKKIGVAYQTLSNPHKRKIYDLGRSEPSDPSINTYEKVIRDFKQRMDAARNAQSVPTETLIRGDDITTDLTLSFSEAVYGCKKKIKIRSPRAVANCTNCNGSGAEPGTRKFSCSSCAGSGKSISFGPNGTRAVACSQCRGRGQIAINSCKLCSGHGKLVHESEITVTIPQGINEGQQLRLAGQGTPGSPPGDLYLNVIVEKHESYKRKGRDLFTSLEIPLQSAIRGGPFVMKALDDSNLTIEIPPGSIGGCEVIVNNAGVKSPLGGTPGNLHVVISTSTPKNLSPRAKKLLEELADELSHN